MGWGRYWHACCGRHPVVADERDIEVSVVIPVYREAAGLPEVLGACRESLDSAGGAFEIIVIDDGSDDDTWSVIQDQTVGHPMLRGIRLSRNFGKEAAICAGMEAARGQAVIVMDGDMQHPPLLIPEMLRLWRETDVDVVEAVKRGRGSEPPAAKWASRLFYKLLKRLSGFDLAGASDFKLMDRRIRRAYLRMGERGLFFRGMVAWLGFKRARIFFDVARRVGGRSKWRFAGLLGLAATGLTAFSSSALRVVNLLGAVFFLLAVVLGARALWVYFTGGAASGITTVVILQLIIGSFLLFGLGVIGEYIARIYDEVKARPRYVISETTAPQENGDA